MGDVIISINAGKSFRYDESLPKNNEVGVLKVTAVTWGDFLELESKTVINDDEINPLYFVKKKVTFYLVEQILWS